MATDATGTPTSPDSIPTYNTAADAPSGLGFNAAMAAIQTAFNNRASKPAGMVSGEAMIWNGATFARSSVTGLTPSGIAGYPASATTYLAGDGTWKTIPVAPISPTHRGYFAATSTAGTMVANQALLIPLVDLDVAFPFTRYGFGVGTASGNMDLGIYSSDDEATFTRLTSVGSFAVPAAGTNLKVIATQTITPVANRRWYLAIAADNGTVTFKLMSDSPATGYTKVTSFPLPASLTGMTAASGIQNSPAILLAV